MIFSKNRLDLEILDVFCITRKNATFRTEQTVNHFLSYRLEGCAEFDVNGKKYYPVKDTLLYIPMGVSYCQSTKEEQIISIHFNVEMETEEEISMHQCSNNEIREKFIKIYDIWTAREKGYYYKCMAIFYEIAALLRIQYEESQFKDKNIELAATLINENVANCKFSISDAVKISNYSDAYFRRLFKKYYNITPVQYLNRIRIGKSLSMLKSGYYSIGEVAYSCGFADANYFGIVFKRLVGCSPREYMIKQKHGSFFSKCR